MKLAKTLFTYGLQKPNLAIYQVCSFCLQNTPDDLQMLSDSPSHHIFVLLTPEVSGKTLPEVLVVLQVSSEFTI